MAQQKKSLTDRLSSFIKRKTSQKYKFNQQFENGTWDGLKGIDELGRYSIITGYTQFFCKQPSVLDLGCGEGILYEKFAPGSYNNYMGIDFSDIAIAKAQQLPGINVRFDVGDLNNLEVHGTFDTIIYNESIYYLKSPETAIKSLLPQLNNEGVFIFSIVDKHGKIQTDYWERFNQILALQDSTRIFNKKGHSWTIQVYKKRAGI